MDLLLAKKYADQLVGELKPFCTRIEIAGSIRRECKQVKDIEIVLSRKTSMLYEFKTAIDKYLSFKGEAIGRYTQREIPTEPFEKLMSTLRFIKADIFMPLPEDYFRQLAIRTGPAEFSHKVIAAGWNSKGWVGTEHGLRLGKECVSWGDKWKLKERYRKGELKITLPPVWQSEQEFFKWLGIRYLDPAQRGLVAV